MAPGMESPAGVPRHGVSNTNNGAGALKTVLISNRQNLGVSADRLHRRGGTPARGTPARGTPARGTPASSRRFIIPAPEARRSCHYGNYASSVTIRRCRIHR